MSSLSVSGKKWILKDVKQEDVRYIKDNFLLDEIVSKLLAIRNIKKEEIQTFLNPLIKNILPNPFVLKDMDLAIKRSCDAILKNEKIGIFGDYDVDGASASALLGKYFNSINRKFEIYIPDRKTEGYGPSEEGFMNLIKNNVNLIFTVDCGTMSFKPIDFAVNKNIDVIVLDHHQSEVNLPKAYSIINPNRIDDKSELNYLCASGVTFMFLVALNKSLRINNWFKENNISEPNLLEYLDLVSLGTVCDLVPLVGLNRAIVKQGLKVLNNKKNLGLKTLLDLCNVQNNLSTYHLGYVIGPRINAGGRVGKCFLGASLLLNNDSKTSFKLAQELEKYNNERKNIENNLLKEILTNSHINISDPVIILSGENWHEGVIGIIASRIKDIYNKPTIIISVTGENCKASARSVVGFDIGSLILNAVQKEFLLKGGGHKMAGGFTIKKDKIISFKDYCIKKFLNTKKNISPEKNIYIDSVIAPSALNINFFSKINHLAPFGSGNPEPRFIIEKLKPINSKIIQDKHISTIFLGSDGSTFKGIAFNAKNSDIGQYLLNKINSTLNVVGKMSLNEWKGEKNVEFIIDDISVNKDKKNNEVPSSIG